MNAYGGNGVGIITPKQKQKPIKTPPANGVTGEKPASSVRQGSDLRTR